MIFNHLCSNKKRVEFQRDTVFFYNPHPNSNVLEKSTGFWADSLCIESRDKDNKDDSKNLSCVEWISESEILMHKKGSVQYWFLTSEESK